MKWAALTLTVHPLSEYSDFKAVMSAFLVGRPLLGDHKGTSGGDALREGRGVRYTRQIGKNAETGPARAARTSQIVVDLADDSTIRDHHSFGLPS
jgi:hypothetical protein